MRINTNMAALNAWRALTVNNENMTKSLEKLSSGYRVNRAADDAAGLAVSEKMRAQIRGLNMAVRNAQDGISLIQTAEGGASQIQTMVQRMRELAVQAANGALTDEDREQLQKEFAQLQDEVTRTAATTKFNQLSLLSDTPESVKVDASLTAAGIRVSIDNDPDTQVTGKTYLVVYKDNRLEIIDGGDTSVATIDLTNGPKTAKAAGFEIDATGFKSDGLTDGTQIGAFVTVEGNSAAPQIELQIGVGANAEDKLTLNMQNLDAKTLGIDASKINIRTAAAARNAINALDTALQTISGARADLGSYQNRLESAIQTLRIQSENLTAAESRIRDVDMAQEMATFTKYQILQQASTAMLAQANMATQSILSLLR